LINLLSQFSIAEAFLPIIINLPSPKNAAPEKADNYDYKSFFENY
jgi:hypothetical protein